MAYLSSSAPFTTLTVTNVNANNTDLLLYDSSLAGNKAKCIVFQLAGTSPVGTISFQTSEDGVTYVALAVSPKAGGATVTTATAVGQWILPVLGRYTRIRTTAYTSGTFGGFAYGTELVIYPSNTTQAVSGTVTANIGTGSIAAGTNLIGDLGLQVRANATGASSKTHLVSAGTTNATIIKASAGRLLGYRISNTNASFRYVKLHNQATTPTAGSGVVETIAIPPTSHISGFIPVQGSAFTTGIGMTTVTGSADADNTAVGAGDLIIDIYWA